MGPMGLGPATGRGLGYCRKPYGRMYGGWGANQPMGRRSGWGLGFNRSTPPEYRSADSLKDYQRFLEEELNYVKGQLKQED